MNQAGNSLSPQVSVGAGEDFFCRWVKFRSLVVFVGETAHNNLLQVSLTCFTSVFWTVETMSAYQLQPRGFCTASTGEFIYLFTAATPSPQLDNNCLSNFPQKHSTLYFSSASLTRDVSL